jgi:hypothetical protein
VGEMIVGNGDVASVLKDRPDRIYFASGVSNSQETKETEYSRELDLLRKQNRQMHLVYFSSLSVFYSSTRYAKHKRMMEKFIIGYFPKHTIIRLGNISWGKNPYTLINYLKTHPEAEIQDVYRYVIDKNEFLHWMDMIPNWSCEMNCPGRRLKVKEIKELYASN